MFRCFLQLFLVETYLLEVREEQYFCLTFVINEHPRDIPLFDVCCDHYCICVWERCEFDVSLGEGYLYMRPLGSHDWAYNRYVIDLAIVLSLLPLIFET
jgi:hypothetical protein